jgi:predicted metal-dependent phosphoesterase TrpH
LELKIDLHVHTCYSSDSLITPNELAFYAEKRGLDGVAVTDHDTLEGAHRISRETHLFIIPGMEIASKNGHILALDIQQSIPPRLSADETVDKIHASGGIAIACHPIGILKGGLGRRTNSKFDAVEVINSSAVPFAYSVKRNEQIANALGKPRVAGSDAHYGPEVGMAYTAVDAELNVAAVTRAVSKGMCLPLGGPIPLSMRVKKTVEFYKRKLQPK